MIVIDARVLADAVADDRGDGRRARIALREAGELAAPDLVDVETLAVLRKRWIAGQLSDQRLDQAVDDLSDLAIDRYPALPLIARASQLRHSLTAYDAIYVALAETLDCDLLTADRRIATAAGPRCPIRVVT